VKKATRFGWSLLKNALKCAPRNKAGISGVKPCAKFSLDLIDCARPCIAASALPAGRYDRVYIHVESSERPQDRGGELL
jgi:hypothetical protein